MILVSAALVLAAIVLLIAGVVLGMAFLVMWSIVISVLSAVCLLIGALLRRHELFPAGGRAAVEAHHAAVAPQLMPQMAHAGMPVYGAPTVVPPTPPASPAYPPNPTVSAPMPVPGLGPDSIVLVIPGRKRFHRSGCRQLVGRETEELTVEEAREEGFSPCTTCVVDAATDDTWATTVQEARVEPADTPGRAGPVPPAASTPPVVPPTVVPPVAPPAAPSLESSDTTAVFRADSGSTGWPEPVAPRRPASPGGWPEPVRPAETKAEPVTRVNPYAKVEPEPKSAVPSFAAAPAEPQKPAEPVKSTEPQKRTEPREPAEPQKRAEHREPAEPQKPAEPEAAKASPKVDSPEPEAPKAAEAPEPEVDEPADEVASPPRSGKPSIAIPEASSSWNAFSRPSAPADDTLAEAEDAPEAPEAVEEEDGEDRDGDTVERKLPPPMVKVMEGTRRYHAPDCPLIKGEDDGIETMSLPAAEEAGLTPCTVCDKS
ncbi:ABC transporter permease [Herbidospora cretacea]|uniref:ABC transporter permease n=1 Tax=Herbidospora cretacea TaxID=28444 RepID=UPI0007735D8D|nr:ABC transporter permease [Herbidospora cretacea]